MRARTEQSGDTKGGKKAGDWLPACLPAFRCTRSNSRSVHYYGDGDGDDAASYFQGRERREKGVFGGPKKTLYSPFMQFQEAL